MPTYDYVCDTCGEFEHFQSMSSPRLKKCPQENCKGKVTRQIGTGAGIIFKGSGFYETDYRSESYKKGEKKASETPKSPEKKTETKKKDSGTNSKASETKKAKK